MYLLAWLVLHETAAISVRSVNTMQPCTMSLSCEVTYVAVTCHLHFWQNDRGHGGGTDAEMRVSTES